MMIDIKTAKKNAVHWFTARNLREQILLISSYFFIFYLLVSFILFRPLENWQAAVENKIAKTQHEITAIQNQIQATTTSFIHTHDPETQHALQQTQQQLTVLDRQLAAYVTELTTPTQMIDVLKKILTEVPGLTLLNMTILPAETMSETDVGSSNTKTLFAQNMRIQLSGDYFQIAEYIKRLEQLDWRIFWDQLDYQVTQYPQAKVTLQLHVLTRHMG